MEEANRNGPATEWGTSGRHVQAAVQCGSSASEGQVLREGGGQKVSPGPRRHSMCVCRGETETKWHGMCWGSGRWDVCVCTESEAQAGTGQICSCNMKWQPCTGRR